MERNDADAITDPPIGLEDLGRGLESRYQPYGKDWRKNGRPKRVSPAPQSHTKPTPGALELLNGPTKHGVLSIPLFERHGSSMRPFRCRSVCAHGSMCDCGADA